jgi:hypothetical protein
MCGIAPPLVIVAFTSRSGSSFVMRLALRSQGAFPGKSGPTGVVIRQRDKEATRNGRTG